ncbi:MAG: type II toxin-antitoxin system PemK/MazF family toxin [Candidatus Magnetomorum sp.]|nr:type II toxin-antitoxin system PemK/MazF family toxin [Candidatus Magnetomorum sp.]
MALEKEDWNDFEQVMLDGIEQQSEIAVDQIRTISKKRLQNKIDSLSKEKTSLLRKYFTIMYGE